jgi:hypothetical protein
VVVVVVVVVVMVMVMVLVMAMVMVLVMARCCWCPLPYHHSRPPLPQQCWQQHPAKGMTMSLSQTGAVAQSAVAQTADHRDVLSVPAWVQPGCCHSRSLVRSAALCSVQVQVVCRTIEWGSEKRMAT